MRATLVLRFPLTVHRSRYPFNRERRTGNGPRVYPCRCLCFALVQITRTTPRLRTILHLSQIFLTDARTFIRRLQLPYDSASRQIAGSQLDQHPVADDQPDEVPVRSAADVRGHPVGPIDLHPIQPARQLFPDDAFHRHE